MTKKKHLSLENREVIAQGIPAGDSAGRRVPEEFLGQKINKKFEKSIAFSVLF